VILRCLLTENFVLSAGVSYDNNRAVQIHPGVTLRF